MKRIVRLTESDLVRLVKRVIREQDETQAPWKKNLAGIIIVDPTTGISMKRNQISVPMSKSQIKGYGCSKGQSREYGEGLDIPFTYSSAVNRFKSRSVTFEEKGYADEYPEGVNVFTIATAAERGKNQFYPCDQFEFSSDNVITKELGFSPKEGDRIAIVVKDSISIK